jgi:hypothetical protein
LPVIKHRQLTREVEAFGATAFESSMDLKINVEFLRINLLLGIFYSALILGDSVFKSKAELKSRSEIQFSVSTNHRVGADVEAYKKKRAGGGAEIITAWLQIPIQSSVVLPDRFARHVDQFTRTAQDKSISAVLTSTVTASYITTRIKRRWRM